MTTPETPAMPNPSAGTPTTGTSPLRIILFLVIGAVLGTLIYYSPTFFQAEEPTVLKTGGTSTMALLMQNGFCIDYRRDKNLNLSYDSVGSTAGLDGLLDGRFEIAFTHAPVSEEQRQKAKGKGGDLIQLPIALCAVVPLYNLPELKDKPPVHFTADVLADIFLGKITRWNDPALLAINKDLELPDKPIKVVYRQDSSGTTLLFVEYLHGASERWRSQFPQVDDELKWPVGEGAERNFGVRTKVETTDGALGYVDLVVAAMSQARYGAVQNRDCSAFIAPEPKHIAAASVAAGLPKGNEYRLTNQPGSDAYPICGAIWAVCLTNQPPSKREQVANFLEWACGEGQKSAPKLQYSPLPEHLIPHVKEQIARIRKPS